MPGTITLPGFETVCPNQVYAQASEHQPPKGHGYRLIDFLLLSRFTLPTEQEVTDRIESVARKMMKHAEIAEMKPVSEEFLRNRTPLEIALMDLPVEVLRNMSKGDIALDCCWSEFDTRMHYLSASMGTIDSETLKKNGKDRYINGPEWYHTAFKKQELIDAGIGEKYTIDILLTDGALPAKNEIEMLLRHRVSASETLMISTDMYPVEEARGIITALYAALPGSERLLFVPDRTEQEIDKYALHSTKFVLEHSETLAFEEEERAMEEENNIARERIVQTVGTERLEEMKKLNRQ